MNLEVKTLRTILDDVALKWYGSIATCHNLAKTMAKMLWAPGTLDLLVALNSVKEISITLTKWGN